MNKSILKSTLAAIVLAIVTYGFNKNEQDEHSIIDEQDAPVMAKLNAEVQNTLSSNNSLILYHDSLTNKRNSVANSSAYQDTVITGQELFRLNCASCHGVDWKGNLPTYPSLVNIKEKLTKEEIRAQIKNGKGLMPPMVHLSDKEIDVIIGFLYDEAEQVMLMASLTPVKQGEMLFKSNCAGCHRATTNDPKPQNANTQMCSMMEPAVLAGATKRFTKDEFLNILETGPCYMPSFSYMKQEEKEALHAYLKTLEGKGEPKGKTMGQNCPMMKKGKSCCSM